MPIVFRKFVKVGWKIVNVSRKTVNLCRKIVKVCTKNVKMCMKIVKLCRKIVKVCEARLIQQSNLHANCSNFNAKVLKITKTPPSCQFVRLVQLVCQKFTNLNTEWRRMGSG